MSKELIRPEQFARVEVVSADPNITVSPEAQKELEALFNGITETFKTGQIVKGKVVKADSDGVVLDIEYKSFGVVPKHEFTEFELKALKEGAELDVIIDELENKDGNVVLSYEKAKSQKAWDDIIKIAAEDKPIQGIVTHKVKGGLSVDIGIPAFLPGSQVDIQRVKDFDQFIGQTITAHVIKVNKKRGNVIISRRKFLSDQRAEARGKVLDTLTEGQIIQGIVKNITNYGVFIDIGGVDGLLHITDMTWGRISHPSEIVKLGDTITVKVLSFDKDNAKISLGMKQLTDNPWQELPADITVGSKVRGKVSSITDYGIFVEIKDGVEGLVHISEISWTNRISDLRKEYKVGDPIDVLIVSLDKENRRMSLSVKQLEKNPWDTLKDKFKPGQIITGKISNITDFGIFVQLTEGIDGLVHISDLSWTEHIDHPSDVYKKGEDVKAVVLSIDEQNKKVSLGIKQLEANPWDTIEETYQVGSIVDGEVAKITNFGAFVKLENGVEGLAHISELTDGKEEDINKILKVGQKTKFRIVKLNKDERKLGLSLKLEAPANKAPKKEEAATAAPKVKKVVKATTSETDSAPKIKSAFQLELEKHAARNKDNK
ncbi:MAG: 30S ribosomal protein S1 [candidate division TM6 bacterium GW2011_GWF2_32_72]|nr:MAG: 30S ribosomal protein S1 [candidate division TM6 bacterium GW2011_GWF2_32_72]